MNTTLNINDIHNLSTVHRNLLARRLHDLGLSYSVVGWIFGVSRQRAHQYVKAAMPVTEFD